MSQTFLRLFFTNNRRVELKRKRPRCFRNVAFIYAGDDRNLSRAEPKGSHAGALARENRPSAGAVFGLLWGSKSGPVALINHCFAGLNSLVRSTGIPTPK